MNDTAQSSSNSISAQPKTYFAAIDYLRIAAAFAIIYFHVAFQLSAPGSAYAFAGLHALTAAAVFFAARSRSTSTDGQIVRKRFERIMIPWLAFSIIHLAIAFYDRRFETWMIWTGGSLHLWFLPFIFIVTCVVAIGARRGMLVQGYAMSIAWIVCGLALLASELRFELPGTVPPPVPQYRNAATAVFFGLAIWSFPRQSSFAVRGIAIALFNIATALIWMALRTDSTKAYPAAALGASVFALCLGVAVEPTRTTAFLGRIAFGVYLVQGLTIRAALIALGKSPINTMITTHPGVFALMTSLIAFVLGFGAVAILERTPLRRIIA